MPSNAQLAVEAVRSFNEWVKERDRAGDWTDYVRGDKLNRTDICKECGFGRAALQQQNPGLVKALAELETRLAKEGVLKAAPLAAQDLTPDQQAHIAAADEQVRRSLSARALVEKRLKTLEEQNAALRAENGELRERLRRTALADVHLAETGRLLPL